MYEIPMFGTNSVVLFGISELEVGTASTNGNTRNFLERCHEKKNTPIYDSNKCAKE